MCVCVCVCVYEGGDVCVCVCVCARMCVCLCQVAVVTNFHATSLINLAVFLWLHFGAEGGENFWDLFPVESALKCRPKDSIIALGL